MFQFSACLNVSSDLTKIKKSFFGIGTLEHQHQITNLEKEKSQRLEWQLKMSLLPGVNLASQRSATSE